MLAFTLAAVGICLALLIACIIINRNIRVAESDAARKRRLMDSFASNLSAVSSTTPQSAPQTSRLASSMNAAGLQVSKITSRVSFIALGLFGFVIGSVCAGVLFGVVCALCIPIIALAVLSALGRRRIKAFDRQFSAALMMVAQSVSSGMSAESAFTSVSEYASDPLKHELSRMMSEVRYGGIALDAALTRLAKRTGSDDVRFLATVTRVQKIGGGSLSEVLTSTSQKIQARIRLRGLVDSVTSSARWTSKVVAIIPFIVLAALVFGAPDIGQTFWEFSLWPLIVIAIAVLDACGLFTMRRLYQMRIE